MFTGRLFVTPYCVCGLFLQQTQTIASCLDFFGVWLILCAKMLHAANRILDV